MTAVNLIVRGRAAYLITDRGHFHADGTVLGFSRKAFRSNRLRMAVGYHGVTSVEAIAEVDAWLHRQQCQDDAMLTLPGIVIEMERQNRAGKAAGDMAGDMDPYIALFLALWRPALKRAEGWIVGSSQGVLGPGYQPGALRRVDRVLSPSVDPALCPDVGFGARRHGLAIVQAQRLVRDDIGASRVAGGADLTIVDASGVRSQTLCEWPDVVGERIAP